FVRRWRCKRPSIQTDEWSKPRRLSAFAFSFQLSTFDFRLSLKQGLGRLEFHLQHLIILVYLELLAESLMVLGGHGQAHSTLRNQREPVASLGVGFGAEAERLGAFEAPWLLESQGQTGLIDGLVCLGVLHQHVDAGPLGGRGARDSSKGHKSEAYGASQARRQPLGRDSEFGVRG